MKTKVLVTLSLILFVTAGLVKADAEKSQRSDLDVQKIQRERASKLAESRSRGRSGQSREEMLKEMKTKRAKAHLAAMQELKDIKKLAEEEGATKTAEAIQKLIDKKDAEYKQEIQKFEQIRKQRSEQVQKRLQEREAKKAAEKDDK